MRTGNSLDSLNAGCQSEQRQFPLREGDHCSTNCDVDQESHILMAAVWEIQPAVAAGRCCWCDDDLSRVLEQSQHHVTNCKAASIGTCKQTHARWKLLFWKFGNSDSSLTWFIRLTREQRQRDGCAMHCPAGKCRSIPST